MIAPHLFHNKNRKTYLILICPLIPLRIKAKRIRKLNCYLMKDLILTSNNPQIFKLCYKYNQKELINCFNTDSIRLLAHTPLELITPNLLDKLNLDYTLLINYLYKGTAYECLNKAGLKYNTIFKIITLKKDLFLKIVKSNELTPNTKKMTTLDKELINSIISKSEINNQTPNIPPPTPNNIFPKNKVLTKSKKLKSSKQKHY